MWVLGRIGQIVSAQNFTANACKKDQTLAGVLRGNTIRGNRTRNSERGSERAFEQTSKTSEALLKTSENLSKLLKTSENPSSQRPSQRPSQRKISLSEPLRLVAPIPVAS